jgi:hypothetical protein
MSLTAHTSCSGSSRINPTRIHVLDPLRPSSKNQPGIGFHGDGMIELDGSSALLIDQLDQRRALTF